MGRGCSPAAPVHTDACDGTPAPLRLNQRIAGSPAAQSHGDWKIVSAADNVVRRMSGDRWSLYNLAEDRCEQVDRVREAPDRLADMIACWERCEAAYRHPTPPGRR